MDCERVRNLLGWFRDGELSRADRSAVAAHLGACPGCAAELAAVTELGEMVRRWGEPEPPADLWDRVARQLGTADPKPAGPARRTPHLWKAVVVAALVLVAAATSWLAHRPGPPDGSPVADRPEPAIPVVDLGPYLARQGPPSPGLSQRMSPEEAAEQVGFRVLPTTDLPDGYSLGETYLVRIQGCSVVQYKYLRGSDVALLLQYSQGQPVTYGNRPEVAIEQVNGKPVQIVRGEGRSVASWTANGTAVSLVGPDDRAELVRLVAHVDRQFSEGKK